MRVRFRKCSNPSGNCVEAGEIAGLAFVSASSHNGGCIEAAHVEEAEFGGDSSYNGNCVEAAPGWVIRDTKAEGLAKDDIYRVTHLHFTAAQWDDGRGIEFALAGRVPDRIRVVAEKRGHDSRAQWYSLTDGTDTLWFDHGEVDSFRSGVKNGVFAPLA